MKIWPPVTWKNVWWRVLRTLIAVGCFSLLIGQLLLHDLMGGPSWSRAVTYVARLPLCFALEFLDFEENIAEEPAKNEAD